MMSEVLGLSPLRLPRLFHNTTNHKLFILFNLLLLELELHIMICDSKICESQLVNYLMSRSGIVPFNLVTDIYFGHLGHIFGKSNFLSLRDQKKIIASDRRSVWMACVAEKSENFRI